MKNYIVTGASQGIGQAAAVKLSYEPGVTSVVIIARNAEKLEETKGKMNPAVNVKVIPADLSDFDAIPAMVKGIYDELGSIEGLVNCAGYVDPQSLLDTTNDNFIKTYNVNVVSMFVIIRECVKYMKGHPSKILNVASTAGITPRPGWLAYASSKAAVVSMSKTLTDELAEYGIKVYCISPGRCATDLRKKLAPEEDPTTIMQPEHVADVIATLMSDNETCLDGQNIIVRQKT